MIEICNRLKESHDCGENAHCIDEVNGFSCRCDFGYNFISTGITTNGISTFCYEQNLEDCRPIFKQYKASTEFNACKEATQDECYVADENGQFSDFRLGCQTKNMLFNLIRSNYMNQI
jgi:hypothetical protein